MCYKVEDREPWQQIAELPGMVGGRESASSCSLCLAYGPSC